MKFGSPYLGKVQQLQEQRHPFLSVCVVFFVCPNNGVAASAWDLTRTQMLMRAVMHRGLYMDIVRECTGSWLRKKNPLPHQWLEPTWMLRLAFLSDTLPTELSLPLMYVYLCWVTPCLPVLSHPLMHITVFVLEILCQLGCHCPERSVYTEFCLQFRLQCQWCHSLGLDHGVLLLPNFIVSAEAYLSLKSDCFQSEHLQNSTYGGLW